MLDEKLMKDVLKLHKEEYYRSKETCEPVNQMRMLYNYVQNLRMVEHINKNKDAEYKYYKCTEKIMSHIIDYENAQSNNLDLSLYDKMLRQAIKEIEIEFDFV